MCQRALTKKANTQGRFEPQAAYSSTCSVKLPLKASQRERLLPRGRGGSQQGCRHGRGGVNGR